MVKCRTLDCPSWRGFTIISAVNRVVRFKIQKHNDKTEFFITSLNDNKDEITNMRRFYYISSVYKVYYCILYLLPRTRILYLLYDWGENQFTWSIFVRIEIRSKKIKLSLKVIDSAVLPKEGGKLFFTKELFSFFQRIKQNKNLTFVNFFTYWRCSFCKFYLNLSDYNKFFICLKTFNFFTPSPETKDWSTKYDFYWQNVLNLNWHIMFMSMTMILDLMNIRYYYF